MKTQCNLANAESYFKEHLQLGDYYSQENQILGEWIGGGAQKLGLSESVKQDQFLKLCHNQHPASGELLTQRMKTTRWDAEKSTTVSNRRVFYDFTFSPPKSVSVQALLAKDSRIVESHNRAVRVAVGELENFAGTRVHNGLLTSEKLTGNIICALFRHDTSRALDPHLHTHCVVFNATHDAEENRWKALSNFEMLRARKLAENVYYHELARDLLKYGYTIKNHPRGDFEIEGISKELCSRFSKRHNEIDERIEQLLRDKPEIANGNLKEIRAQIAQAERSRKIPGIEGSALRRLWDGQLTNDEKQTLKSLATSAETTIPAQKAIGAKESLNWAEAHLFDRRSVLHERELWSSALEYGRGSSFTLDEVKATTRNADYVRDKDHAGKLTSLEVLSREWDIVCMAKEGRGKHNALHSNHSPSTGLSSDQLQAAQHILGSRDFITLFSGGAGTGKSYALREIGNALKDAGHVFRVIAPQRQQALDLGKDFEQTKTVSDFLSKAEMTSGSVVIVDEAGQVGGKQMHQLLSFVHSNGGRVILSGDTRQHGAVECSDALRAIERYSGLSPARLTKIRRQNPKLGKTKSERNRIKKYRTAVRQAQIGNYTNSFDILEKLGAVVECRTKDEQQEKLVSAYLDLALGKKSTVVVSQTWGEIHEINERIRIGLRSAGLLGKKDFCITALGRVDLTEAQKRDARFYSDNALVVFNRDSSEFKKGDIGKLLKVTDSHLVVESNANIRKVPFKHLNRINVCQRSDINIAVGDQLQLKANRKSHDGSSFANGELVSVKKVEKNGIIHLKDGRQLPPDYREFVHGYAVTSYGSQGKTVENVLFSDSAVKAATNNQQWLVSISRGKRSIKIFTQNKAELRENISRSGDRELAIEMAVPLEINAGKTPLPVRRYIENLIRIRRGHEGERKETNKWTPEPHSKPVQTARHGMRI